MLHIMLHIIIKTPVKHSIFIKKSYFYKHFVEVYLSLVSCILHLPIICLDTRELYILS